MAVFSVACMVLYKYASRFVKDVDDSTMEVADYTGVWQLQPLVSNRTAQQQLVAADVGAISNARATEQRAAEPLLYSKYICYVGGKVKQQPTLKLPS